MNIWPFSTIRKLRAEVERLDERETELLADAASLDQELIWIYEVVNHPKSSSEPVSAAVERIVNENTRLKAELEQARRNDMPRDKFGRFVSKVGK